MEAAGIEPAQRFRRLEFSVRRESRFCPSLVTRGVGTSGSTSHSDGRDGLPVERCWGPFLMTTVAGGRHEHER